MFPLIYVILFTTDLREDRGYAADHMGSNIITTAQVCFVSFSRPSIQI